MNTKDGEEIRRVIEKILWKNYDDSVAHNMEEESEEILAAIKPLIEKELQQREEEVRRKTETKLMEDIEKVSPMSIQACHCCGGAIKNHWRGLHNEIAEIRHIIKETS